MTLKEREVQVMHIVQYLDAGMRSTAESTTDFSGKDAPWRIHIGGEMNLTDPKQDDRIRAALRNADKRGQLQVVAAITGIAGGVQELRKIMNSTGELSIMDRGMLALHLS
ncbi:hypothetical protein ACFZOW_17155 [Pseudomonas aeruginosa]